MTERQILTGIRVIDLSQGIAGPVAGLLLAEAGADVIKVEPPGGELMRGTPGFATWNRSKRGVTLDLRDGGDRAKLATLLRGADVVIHSLRPAVAARHGLDDASLAKLNPALIACSIPAYPVGHPDQDRAGYDSTVLARMGLMDEQKGARPGPIFIRFPLATWGAVYLATNGILARLFNRGRTGTAGPAHTSLTQGALIPMTMHWARAERPTEPFTYGIPKLLPPTMFECADGVWLHIMSTPEKGKLMPQLLAEMPAEEIREANASVPPNRAYPNVGAYGVAFRRRDSATWLEDLWANDVSVQPAVSLGKVFYDEQANANGYVLEVEDPQYGKTRQAGIPFTTDPPSRVKGPAPRLGQHQEEVFAEERAAPVLTGSGKATRWPLEGVRVVDFGNFLAGPLAPMLMADLGADVIKLEAITGDQMRGTERAFAGCQRGKRGIAADLKRPEARAIVEALSKWADVVHHNIRMPAARKLGIDPETLRAYNPQMVYCHTSSYGPVGPRKDWPGFDQLFQAAAGWEYEGAGEGNQPIWHRFGMMDHQCASASLVATLLGLIERDRTGQGQFVSASLLGASVLTISETMVLPDGTLAPYPKLDREQTGLSAGYRNYLCADGWVSVAAVGEAALARLVAAAGAKDASCLAEALRGRETAEVLAAMDAAGVVAEPVRLDQTEAFLDNPAHLASGLAVSYPHLVYGKLDQVGGLQNFGDLQPRLDRSPPILGQSTAEILREVGFAGAQILELAMAGVIAGPGLPAPGPG